MLSSIKKEVVTVTILFVVIMSIIVYNMTTDFMIYDFIYMSMFVSFYIRYLKIKKKQKDYIEM